MMEPGCFIGLEISSSKIAAVAGVKEGNSVKLLGFSEKKVVPSNEILKDGVVINGETTSEFIGDVLDDIVKSFEKTDYEFDIETVNVNIANLTIKSHTKKATIISSNEFNKITQNDVDRLFADVTNAFTNSMPAGHTIIHSLPKEFSVNDEKASGTLVGKFGNHLQGEFTFITSKNHGIERLTQCVNQVPAKSKSRDCLKIQNIYLNGIADTCSLLNNSSEDPESKKDGVAIVNIGADFTQISIYHNNSLRYQSIIPIAGNTINKDLQQAFSITFEEAEKLKVVCGSLPPQVYDEAPIVVIEKKYGMNPTEVYLKNAYSVVEARLKEIAIIVKAEIYKSGYATQLLNGIILTGGTSYIIRLKDIFKSVLKNINVRNIEFNQALDFREFKNLRNPKYSTLLGLIMAPAFDFDKRLSNKILTPKPIHNKTLVPTPSHTPLAETASKPSPEKPAGGGFMSLINGIFGNKGKDLNDSY